MKILLLTILLLQIVTTAAVNKNITLRTAINPTEPFAFKDPANNNTWSGFSIDLASLLTTEALKDNYTLTFAGDGDSILEMSGDDSLKYISPDCDENCYDIILGIYLQTTERSANSTFLQPFSSHYLTPIVRSDSTYKTFEEVIANNGTTCTTEPWSEYSGFETDTKCKDQDTCYTLLQDGGCDLFAAYRFQAGYRSVNDPELFEGLEITGEILTDVNWVSLPTNMALPSESIVMLSKWMYNVYAGGTLGELQEKWFGYKDDDFTQYFPKEMSVTSGVYRNKPQAYQAEDGKWIGIVFDSADSIIAKAKESGVDLTIDIDTSTNGIVSDFEGELGTPTGSLATVSPDCVGTQVYLNAKNGEICHDMILGAYTMNPARAELTTFLPPYQSIYLTVTSQSKFGVQTIADANEIGGDVCLWDGSYAFATLESMVDNPKLCATQAECYEMVADGHCVLTVDGIASALVQAKEYPGLYVTKEVIPNTETEYNTFPMSTALDPTTKVALALWQHEVTSDIDLAMVGLEYLDTGDDDTSTPESTDGTSSGEYVKQSWFVGLCMLGLAILYH